MRLIDADALKSKFRCSYDGSKGDCYAPTCKGCRDNVLLEEDIDEAPTIEPKQGEFKCTECYRTFSKFSNESFNYCPHCGREVGGNEK